MVSSSLPDLLMLSQWLPKVFSLQYSEILLKRHSTGLLDGSRQQSGSAQRGVPADRCHLA